MILSVSRRTDIPAFYYPWFLERLKAGFVLTVNPFNPRQLTRVPLTPQGLDAAVFWSKDPSPLLRQPPPGLPWYLQFTLNDYPAWVEAALPGVQERIATFRALAALGGPASVVWRYDPILFAPGLDGAWHAARFSRLASALEGATDQAVISFLDPYARIGPWLRRSGVSFPDSEQRLALALTLEEIGRQHGIRVTACCEADLPLPVACCIDPDRLARLIGPLSLPPDRGQRPACGCADSIDIGCYDSCLHGCGYCYATHFAAARRNHAAHDPTSPLLIGSPHPEARIRQLSPVSCRTMI